MCDFMPISYKTAKLYDGKNVELIWNSLKLHGLVKDVTKTEITIWHKDFGLNSKSLIECESIREDFFGCDKYESKHK